MQCSEMKCSVVRCSAVQCSAVKLSAVQCSAVIYSALRRREKYLEDSFHKQLTFAVLLKRPAERGAALIVYS